MSQTSGGTLATLAAGAAVLGAAALAGVAAGSAGIAAEDAPRGGTLRIWSHVDADSIDPALGYLRNAWLIADASCARLYGYRTPAGASSARIVPEVARSYRVSRDRRTYTFALRRSFRFHTGERVTARSFADAFDRDAKAPLSPAQPYLREIVGATAAIDGNAASISGIRVLAPGATDRRGSTGSCGRSAGHSRSASGPSRRTGPTGAVTRGLPVTHGAVSPKSTASTAPEASSS